MKRYLKLFAILFALTLLFAGCTKKNENENGKKETEVKDETLVKIKDKEFHIDTDKEFEGLKYKIISDFREINNETPSSKYVQYDYRPDGSANYLFFRIFFYQGKDIDFAKKDMIQEEFEYQDGKTNGIDYKLIDEGRSDGTIHYYFIYKDGNTYVLDFVSQNDIKDFENKVIKSLSF